MKNFQKFFAGTILSLAALAFFLPARATAPLYDLSISSGDIFFKKTPLLAGERTRIYARVTNRGTADMTGLVSFHQGSILIGEPQVVSARADSVPDEVFVDFIVPEGAFNIRAEIRGTAPEDQDAANNVAVSAVIVPEPDKDRDGIADARDNCPEAVNAEQKDTDGDGVGDACDPDSDNDGLANAEEAKLKTDPLTVDTDGDGVNDSLDFYPVDKSRSVKETPATKLAESPAFPKSLTSAPAKPRLVGVAKPYLNATEIEEVETEPGAVSAGSASGLDSVEPRLDIEAKRRAWNLYEFKASGPLEHLLPGVDANAEDIPRYLWEVGGAPAGAGPIMEHRFASPGVYEVNLVVVYGDSQIAQATKKIHISFFNFGNPRFLVLLTLLSALFLAGLIFSRTISAKSRPFPW